MAISTTASCKNIPDSKIHGANIRPTWVLSAPGGPHVGPMNLAIRDMQPRWGSSFGPAYVKDTHRRHTDILGWFCGLKHKKFLCKCVLEARQNLNPKVPAYLESEWIETTNEALTSHTMQHTLLVHRQSTIFLNVQSISWQHLTHTPYT